MRFLFPLLTVCFAVSCSPRTTAPADFRAFVKDDPIRAPRAAIANGDLKGAEGSLAKYIEANENDPDAATQDHVTEARIAMGFVKSKQKDFVMAAATFKAAADQYKGLGISDPNHGRLDDQAAYQAIVCLQAQGQKLEAIAAYEEYMKDRPLSPSVRGAHDRLLKLNPGKAKEYDQALELAQARKEREMLRLANLCGPKVINELLRVQGKPTRSEDDLVALCKTGAQGSSMDGMASALTQLGYDSNGYLLNWQDFVKQQAPFIWLKEGHYLLIKKLTYGEALCYDPYIERDRILAIPTSNDPEFSATVLTLNAH